MSKLHFGKYTVDTSNEDKVLFPDSGITKADLINYYKKISKWMLPYLEDRPITMLRYPNGIKGKKFFQKDEPDYFPGWIKTRKIKRKEGGSVNHVICNNTATLVYVANQACITPHIWLSKIDRLNYPDKLIFDLDPSDEDFSKVKFAAKKLRKLLKYELGLTTFVQTTGSRGLHLIIPLSKKENYNTVRNFAQKAAMFISKENKNRITNEVRKEKRKGRLFIDTARNVYAQTFVAPFAVRAKPKAPVAVPLSWDELSKKNMNSQKYNISNIFKRLNNIEDPWKNFKRYGKSISSADKKLSKLIKE